MDILKVKNLSKYYGEDNNLVKALDNISFNVEKGEFVCVTGESGSGKSTLLYLIGGLEKETDGQIWIEDTYITNLKEDQMALFRRRNLGIIYEFHNLISSLNVRDNILFPLKLDKQKCSEKRLNELMQTMGIYDRIRFFPNELSLGQMKRVALIRALIHNPSIILADEPTGALDSKSKKEMINLLKLANKKYNQTIMLVTHDEEIALMADRIIYLKDGKIDSIQKGGMIMYD